MLNSPDTVLVPIAYALSPLGERFCENIVVCLKLIFAAINEFFMMVKVKIDRIIDLF